MVKSSKYAIEFFNKNIKQSSDFPRITIPGLSSIVINDEILISNVSFDCNAKQKIVMNACWLLSSLSFINWYMCLGVITVLKSLNIFGFKLIIWLKVAITDILSSSLEEFK